MLKLLVRDLDICRVSKVLERNKLKASITYSTIIIDSNEITDEVIDNLFENATIIGAQNYHTSDDARCLLLMTRLPCSVLLIMRKDLQFSFLLD